MIDPEDEIVFGRGKRAFKYNQSKSRAGVSGLFGDRSPSAKSSPMRLPGLQLSAASIFILPSYTS